MSAFGLRLRYLHAISKVATMLDAGQCPDVTRAESVLRRYWRKVEELDRIIGDV